VKPREPLTGGGAIVAQLVRHGIDTMFGLPGPQTSALFDALGSAGHIRLINPRHEHGCSHLAFGAARSTGRPAVYTVQPGPGVLNSAAGLLGAYACNQPVLCITGKAPSSHRGHGPDPGQGQGQGHELPDQLAMLRGITKWSAHIERGSDAPTLVAQAFAAMTSGRPGPAALEMPSDVMDAPARATPVEPVVTSAPPLDLSALDEASAALSRARRPMILVGGGAIDAADDVRRLAELLGAPVVAFRSGRGIVAEDHPLGVSIVAARHLWESTDTFLAIGTRLGLVDRRWSSDPAGTMSIRIDIDGAEFTRRPATINVPADAGVAVRGLVALLERLPLQTEGRRAEIAAAKADATHRLRTSQPLLDHLDVIREVLPRDAIICDDLTQVGPAGSIGLPVYEPRTYLTPGCQGTLGSGFLTALGAKAVNPDRSVVSLTGDGGFLFGMQDLATAREHRLGVVTIVFNSGTFSSGAFSSGGFSDGAPGHTVPTDDVPSDGAPGNALPGRRARFEARTVGSSLHTPDLVALARTVGVAAARATGPAGLRTLLAHAVESGEPWLIDVTVAPGREADPWALTHPTVATSPEP
jgi:acetolactate synthase-1/2/3 large subunit